MQCWRTFRELKPTSKNEDFDVAEEKFLAVKLKSPAPRIGMIPAVPLAKVCRQSSPK